MDAELRPDNAAAAVGPNHVVRLNIKLISRLHLHGVGDDPVLLLVERIQPPAKAQIHRRQFLAPLLQATLFPNLRAPERRFRRWPRPFPPPGLTNRFRIRWHAQARKLETGKSGAEDNVRWVIFR